MADITDEILKNNLMKNYEICCCSSLKKNTYINIIITG